MHWFRAPLRRYADFTGRARRTDYWMFVLFAVLVAILLAFLDEGLRWTYAPPDVLRGLPFVAGTGVLGTIFSLALVVPTLAIGARRLHDIGLSGWLQLLWVVPVIGSIVLVVLFVINGNRGPNRYGADPKETAEAEPGPPT